MDPGGAFGAIEHPETGQGAEKRLQGGVVLGREHLSGGQEGRLTSASDHLEHGAQGHEGLAAAHVTLEEALHGDGTGQIGSDLLADPHLSGGEVVGQGGVEVGSQGGSRLRLRPCHRGPGALVVSPTLGQGHLKNEGLLMAQPAPGGLPLVGVLGPVHPAVGGVGVDKTGRTP